MAWLVVTTISVPALRAEPLTLDDAVTRAEARSPYLRAAGGRLEAARGRRRIAGYLTPQNPTIAGGLTSDAAFHDQGEGTLEITVAQELEIFGQRGLRIDVAEAEVAGARLDVDGTRRAVRATVVAAYFDLRYQEQRADALTAVVEQAERLAQAAQRRLAAGDISEAEANLIAADRVQARAEARDAGADRASALTRINILIGEELEARTSTSTEFPAPAPAVPLEILETRARTRPDLVAAARAVEARGREVTLRRRERWPNPQLELGITRERSVFDLATPGDGTGVTQLSDTDWLLGVRLAIPLPFLRAGGGEIREAAGRKAEAEADRDALAATIADQVATALARYESARAGVADYAGLEPKLASTLDLYERAYASGKIDLTQYLAARDRILRARLAALRARRDAAIAAAELERAVGGAFTEGK